MNDYNYASNFPSLIEFRLESSAFVADAESFFHISGAMILQEIDLLYATPASARRDATGRVIG